MISARGRASRILVPAREPGRPLPRQRWALPASLAAGAVLALAFPPYGIWPLAVTGPALLVLLLHGRGWRASFGCGLAFGLGFYFFLLSWLLNVAWYAWVTLAVAEALLFAVLVLGLRLLLALRYWPVLVAGWWVTMEGVHDRWPWPFPWGRLAMSQAGAPDQGWMAVGGAPVLGFAIALAGALIAWVVLTWGTSSRFRAGPVSLPRSLPLALLVLALLPSIALVPVDPAGGASSARVAAIQGNVPRARNLPSQLNDWEVTRNQEQATLQLAGRVRSGRAAAPDLVLWPENATDIDPRRSPVTYQQIAGAVAGIGKPVLVGEVLDNPRRNVGQLWTPAGGPGPMYVKRQLVPFGEYIPLRGFISHFTSLTKLQPVDFVAGHRAVVFRVGKIRLGDVICYEVGFDQMVRSEVNGGANLLVVQSNDADFEIDGQTGESAQQVAMARLRAVESDRAVVYVSISGESAIFTPGGAEVAHSGIWQRAILEHQVSLRTYRTLADRLGPWPDLLIMAGTGLAMLAALLLSFGIVREWAGRLRWTRRS